MKRVAGLVSLLSILSLVAACSSDSTTNQQGSSDSGTQADTGKGPGSDAGTSDVPATNGVTVTGDITVPADFAGTPKKIIFGIGTKRIIEDDGKLSNVPSKFLPTIAGIPAAGITPGQPYRMEMKDLDIAPGDYYVLVALYVEGTAGTIPEKDKDYVAGSATPITFSGGSVSLPAMTFRKSAGMQQ